LKDPHARGESTESGQRGTFASFRDPDGVLIRCPGRMVRLVKPAASADLSAFLNTACAREFLDRGRLVRTTVLSGQGNPANFEPSIQAQIERFEGGMVLEHERIPFPSFPYEWPPEMLHSAAELTLELAVTPLDEGFGLKDATPYNVLFRGPDPVFVDLLSFERRQPGDPTWRPYAQFVRTFLLPLLLSKHYGLRLDQVLTTRRDGLEPEEVHRLLKTLDKIRPPFLSLVTMPKWLGHSVDADDTAIYRQKLLDNKEKSDFILKSLFGGLRRSLRRAAPVSQTKSTWSGYMQGGNTYSTEQFEAKCAFLQQMLDECRPKRVLDVGCNTGHFSLLAAGAGASVVAIDQDPVVVGETWSAAVSKRADVLPLVVDLCRPTPATGWMNRECPSFLDRARGAFDAVLMLAVMHHMLVTERIPLESILEIAAELTSDALVIEFIGPDDPMFRRLVRGREELHRDLTVTQFESACRDRFEIIRSQRLEGASRWLYLLRKSRVQGA
jgi:SAM-dependent methyltransferase